LQAIRVIHEDGLLGIATGCDVVERTGKFKAEWAGHEWHDRETMVQSED
jgi:hypothetical protein